jgi:hypothetical protein
MNDNESVRSWIERCRAADEERVRLGVQEQFLNRPWRSPEEQWLERNRGMPAWKRRFEQRFGQRR